MRFKEDHRETLTRVQIATKLKKDGTQGAIFLAIPMLLVIIIPLAFLMAVLQIKELIIVGSIIIALALALVIYSVSLAISVLYKVNSGKYTVIEDSLISVTEDIYYKRGRRSGLPIEHHDYIFLFNSGKEYKASSPLSNDETRIMFSATHSNPGDIFYVVTFDNAPMKPVLIYSGVLFKLDNR